MTKRVVKTWIKGSFLSLLFLLSIACEDDLNSVNADFIDSDVFETNSLENIEVQTQTITTEKVNTVGLGEYLLGNFEETAFGRLQAAIAGQVNLPSGGIRPSQKRYLKPEEVVSEIDTFFPVLGDISTRTLYSIDRKFDAVFLIMPYHSSTSHESGEQRSYELDSVYGETDTNLKISVSQLGEFLSLQDPTDPTEENAYYSNRDFEAAVPFERVLGEKEFVPIPTDTVVYFDRHFSTKTIKDSILIANAAPFIAIPLNMDPAYFKTEFLDDFTFTTDDTPLDRFAENEDFTRFFKGVYIKTNEETTTLLSLPITNAYLSFNYTDYITATIEDNTTIVLDTVFREEKLSLNTINVNTYDHNHDQSSEVDVTEKLYVQGTGGYDVAVDLFNKESIESLREEANKEGEEWLINEASLKLYVHKEYEDRISYPYPEDGDWDLQRSNVILFLYRQPTDAAGIQLLDYFSNSPFYSIQGILRYDSETEDYYYKFYLTDYITNLLQDEESNTDDIDPLVVKTYVSGDNPSTNSDTSVDSKNWQHRGVVLDASKSEFKLNYSKKN
jgi:hypothetical protein